MAFKRRSQVRREGKRSCSLSNSRRCLISSVATAVSVILMLLGWFVIYICCHALAHWAIGRVVGIRFRGYGVRGTDHPENYPPLLRPSAAWAIRRTMGATSSTVRVGPARVSKLSKLRRV